MSNGLSVSRLINVQKNLSPNAAQAPAINTLLVLGTSTVIDTVTRMREYSGPDGVAADFGTNAEEYLAAVVWFEQKPQPTSMFVGRWAKNAAAGQLLGGPVSAANQMIAAWNAIANGSVQFTIDGHAATNLANLNFAAAATLNAVAAIITTALAGAATVVWNAAYKRFEATSGTTGANSSVAFAAATGAGTDISNMLAMRNNSPGAYVAPGIAAESALAAVTMLDQMFSSQWYGLVVPSGASADHLAVAGYIEAANPAHYYGVTTQDANALVATATTDIAYQLANGTFDKTCCQYSSSNAYAVVSYLARILTTDFTASNSTITLMYKTEPGITAENLLPSQADALKAKNCNVFVEYNNSTAIIQYGTSSSGQYTDSVIGADWLADQVQTNIFNLFYANSKKVPQADGGMHQIGTQIEAALGEAVDDGLLAPGVWNAGGFGQLKQGDYLDKSYYVYVPPIASQSQADRAARKSVPFQVAAKLGGAVHEADVMINFNS